MNNRMGLGRRKQNRRPANIHRQYAGIKAAKSDKKPRNGKKFSMSSKARLLGILIVLTAAAVLAVHWPALSARAVSLDDDQYLINNPLVQNPDWVNAGRFFTEILKPSTVKGYYQPFTMISLMLDCAMGGQADNLVVFHRTSLIFHVMNTILIILFLYFLFEQPWIAAMAGLLFGVHPMTVESVTWLAERKTMLAAFFSLLSLIFYVLYIRRSNRKYYWTSLFLFIPALMSKPTSTPLPVLMLLLDYWPVKRLNWKAVREKAPFFAAGIISAVITFLSQKYTGFAELPGRGESPVQILLAVCHDIIFYLYKIIWPVNLSSHYPVPVPLSISNPVVLAGVAGTLILIPALLISLRRTRALLTGWLFFFIGVFPTMGVIGFTNVIAADKYAYLPLTGFLLILAWLLDSLWNRGEAVGKQGLATAQIWLLVVVLIISASEASATRNYLASWRDSEILYGHMLSLAPKDPVLYNNLGMILKEQKKFDEAISQYNEAIRLNPDEAKVYNNLGMALVEKGKVDEAILQYKKAISLNPDIAEAYINLGMALARLGKTDEAISRYKEAIRINPNEAKAYNNLGNAFAKQGKLDEAIAQYNEAIRVNPGLANAYNNLGAALANQGKLDDAVTVFRKAVQLQMQNAQAHDNLGKALAEQGNMDEAIKEFREALRINPDLVEAQNDLEAALQLQP